jgi:hypothetical protein
MPVLFSRRTSSVRTDFKQGRISNSIEQSEMSTQRSRATVAKRTYNRWLSGDGV